MQSLSRPRQFYKIAALSMIVAGSAVLLFSAWEVLKPRAACQDQLVFDDERTDILAMRPAHCIDPWFEPAPSSNYFIPIILSLCLMAFGGAIIGMIVRLSPR